MPSNRKSSTARRPARAKGALPAPKVAPRRTLRKWHQQPVVRIAAGLILAAAVAFSVWQFTQARKRADEERRAARAVRQFDQKLQLLQSRTGPVFEAANKAPDEFKAGTIGEEDFKAQLNAWLAIFQEVDSELRSATVPGTLEKARALLVQGTTIYIDAMKVFQVAALAPAGEARDQAVAQGKNLMYHANFIYGNGFRELNDAKVETGVARAPEGGPVQEPVSIPEREAPAAPLPTEGPPPAG